MKPLVEVRDMCKIYNPGENEVRALDHVSLTIDQGEFVGIIGHSGSGKSTLMNMLGCLDIPTSGSYYLNGKDVSHMSDDELSDIRNVEIGFIFQGFNLIPNLTAQENVELPLIYRGVGKKEREALAKAGRLPADGRGLSGFADLPDLILIDGGPQQLRFAREAMLKVGYDIPIFGLAKRLEEIFLPDREESILLDRKSPALHLIQRVRDEAHRFGITHHRDLRQKAGMHSTLEDIPGVGATRRRALLTHFKSVANIAAATPEALCEVEGIGKAQAKAIWDYYHPEEKESGGAKP